MSIVEMTSFGACGERSLLYSSEGVTSQTHVYILTSWRREAMVVRH